MGHAGTLDPEATGVLPICLGQGTRIAEFLTAGTKTYQAQIELGTVTDTYDATGKVIQQEDPSSVTRQEVESALTTFLGLIEQTPPIYSAIKYHGKRLYQLARAGFEVERKARKVETLRLDLIDWDPPLVTIEVECGKGTYIRSLAHDLGQKVGCGAHLKSLIRLKCGPFFLKGAIPLSQLESAFHEGWWQDLLHPIDSVLLQWQATILGGVNERAVRNGRCLRFEEGKQQVAGNYLEYCRAYSLDGCFLAVLRFCAETGLWHPEKVFLHSLEPHQG